MMKILGTSFCSKRIYACMVTSLLVLTVLLWYVNSKERGELGSYDWEKEEKEMISAIRKTQSDRSHYEQSNPVVDMSEFSFEKFMERRNAKLAKTRKKKEREGDIHVYKPLRVVLKSSCVPFKTMMNGTRLCVHSKQFDPFISSHIRDLGTWEGDYLVAMETALRNNPSMHVVDMGCNVGAYTFYAALMGRKVVAIDPIRINLFMVHSTLKYAGLRKNAVLLLNAVSEYAEPVRVILNKENIGGSSIEPVPDNYNGSDAIVNAILMDDLLRVVDFNVVFLKLDIEAHEWKALHRASKFFKQLDVRYVMMEWIFYKHNVAGHEVIEFFQSRGYLPFVDVLKKNPLDFKTHHLWPENVFWCKA